MPAFSRAQVDVRWIYSADLEQCGVELLWDAPGSWCRAVLAPGVRKDIAARFARERGIPIWGYACGCTGNSRVCSHVAGLTGANSTEFNPETPMLL